MVTLSDGLEAEICLGTSQAALREILLSLTHVTHAHREQIQFNLSEFLLQEFFVETFVDLQEEGRGFLVHFGVADLEYDLDQSFDTDQFEVKDLELRLKGRHDLAILLVYVDEEVLEAAIDCLCEEAEV